ncbi:hypothetical protein GGH13_002239 [Coemansia sp. S155-1]|nr:hypothetical protein GGI14_002612 [Coemansia sp. S680]KAJ2073095.1 hypothetical protein GGH13_002239 [Coemansia sp. S155-1]
MLARRTFWLSAVSKEIAATRRRQHLPFPCLPQFRRLSSQSPARPSADIQKAIVDEARLLQQEDKSIPWYRLVAKYHLSIDTLQSIYNQAEVDTQRRQQMSALVTKTAERHFDSALGQCNWEAVASELDTPLIACLDHFNASNSMIKPRSPIETYGGWSKVDMGKLEQFIAANYADSSSVDWRLAGAYMNIDALECQRVGLGTFNDPINELGYRRVCEFRESVMSWKDIHQHFQQYANVSLLKGKCLVFKRKLDGVTGVRLTSKWTDADLERMKDLIEKHLESATRSELVDIIQRELPARPLSDIRLLFGRYLYKLRAGRMHSGQMIRLRELVAEYGEDWDRIGETLGVLPCRAQRNWLEHGGNVGGNSSWTSDETRQFQQLVSSGVKAKEAVKLLKTKPYWAFQDKKSRINTVAKQQGDGTFSGSCWSAADDETLLKMIDGSTASAAAKWEQVRKALGRSVIACQHRFLAISNSRSQVADDHRNSVTSEVQRQLKSNSTVDWSQVSQETGFGLRECLELSQYDVGKARWQYDPDSFSQSMADRLTGFIKEHYPVPTPVSYRAVSNYMWVDMDDCIRIHELLQGKFKWTEADCERVIALRAQGLMFKEVARQLSPTLATGTVKGALRRYLLPKPVQKPISADELVEVSRLVDEYAGKYPVTDLFTKIRTQLNLTNRYHSHQSIVKCIAAHPHYQTKIRNIDYNDLANRIATGQTTAKLAAMEFDVPLRNIEVRMRAVDNRLYSSKWTEEETRKLVDYMQSCDSKPDLVYFSKVLGTKSPIHCSRKITRLRHNGVLPHVPKTG